MKIVTGALVVSLLLGALASLAADPPMAPAAKEVCSNIRWNADFLTRYPKAPATCRSIEVRDGVKYAKFVGTVSKVTPTFVEVSLLNVANSPISTIAFEVGVGGQLTVGDKVEKVSDLKTNDQLTLYIKEGEFGVSPTLTDKPLRILKPDAMPTP